MKRRADLDNKDFLFGDWLFANGWKSNSLLHGWVNYFDNDGKQIAWARYDNIACTYEVWTNEV